VAQLIAIEIASSSHRRQGHGRRLLDAAIDQMLRYHAARHYKLRRIWAVLRHKDHVIARAFLAGRGFQHVSSIPDLFHGQDCLVYVKSMD
jgi:ribosomal protein S18 acetylase RimI-like enzyme